MSEPRPPVVSARDIGYPADASVDRLDTVDTSGALDRNVALVDVLDRVLAGGVVVSGELTLSIADVDLVHISLRTLLSSVSALLPPPEP
ncbi:gas vesicle protein [Amycolatopsis taiwanensis]|uniref:Gas vesicle protein n=1 Tax=Amycolatopsis taiwanensis TaxID=342230 RepID=A0A9W6VDV1_9PSEU|nr:gas vesicle protein [Amycolatopsis taiwanensis]GLY65135.1 hypothetical protein Atai01_17540 [Amycolatopsis taiwanensis]